MLLTKPKSEIRRIVVTARDATGDLPSKSTTLYETTPEQVIEALEGLVREAEESDARSADHPAPPLSPDDKSTSINGKSPAAA